MRARFALSALAVAILSSPLFLHAQFQQPTQEELQMTQDPKAPGADAIYLYREETSDDNLHFHTYYERIKVLTEKGKELATIHIPYERSTFKITNIEGRTIHSDGVIVPLTAKPSDLIDVKAAKYQYNTMVFTLPNVEVGSILEYRLSLRYDDDVVSSPNWTIQKSCYVRKAHYVFTPSSHGGFITSERGDVLNQLMWYVRANDGAKVVHDPQNHYTFDVVDVPPSPDEDWMPPLNSLTWRVQFYYSQYHSGAEFWQGEAKHWAKNADKFSNPSKPLQQAAAGIVAAGDTDEQKARKLYAAVMQLENTGFLRQKSEAERKKENLKDIRDAEDVWNQKSGSPDNIALLYVALARAAGLQAWPMQVVDRDRAIFDPNYLSTYQLDDYIAIVSIGGKEVFVDPGQKDCPFGLLHWKHALTAGLRLSAKGPLLDRTPPDIFKQATTTRVADLTLDGIGNVSGSVRFVLTGGEALRWRQLALENDAEEVEKQFDESIKESIPEGVRVDFDHFLGLDDYDSNLIAIVNVSGNTGSATGKHVFLPGLFFESRAKHPFVAEEKRLIPIDVHYPTLVEDQVTYHLPAGVEAESLPQATSLQWPDHAILQIKASSHGNTATIGRALVYNYATLGAADYAGLHDFYQKVATADQQQLVLSRAPAMAKGN